MEFCKHCYQKDKLSLIQTNPSPTWHEGSGEEISVYLEIKTYFCSRCHDVSIEAELHDSESINLASQYHEVFSPETKLLYPAIKPLEKDYFQKIKSNWSNAYRPEDTDWWLDYCFPDGEGVAELRQTYDDMLFAFGHERYSLCYICARKILDILSQLITLKNDEGSLDARLKWMEKENVIDKTALGWAMAVKKIGNKSVHGNSLDISPAYAGTIVTLVNYLLDYFFVIVPEFRKLETFNKIENAEFENVVEKIDTGLCESLLEELKAPKETQEDWLKGFIASASLLKCRAYVEEATNYFVCNLHQLPDFKDAVKKFLKSFSSQLTPIVKEIFFESSDLDIKKKALEIIEAIGNDSEDVNDFYIEVLDLEPDSSIKKSVVKYLLKSKHWNILKLHKKGESF